MEVLNMQEQLLDHEGRLKTLEQNYHKLEGKLTSVENGQLQLENTVLKTSQDQRELLNKLVDHTLDLKKVKETGNVEMDKLRLASRKEIIVAILSGGSIIGLVLGAFLKFL